MTEATILETVRQAFQDLIAPDIRELKANHASLEKITEVRFAAVSERFTSLEKRMDDRFSSFEKQMDDRFDAMSKQMQAESENAMPSSPRSLLIYAKPAPRPETRPRSRCTTLPNASRWSNRASRSITPANSPNSSTGPQPKRS